MSIKVESVTSMERELGAHPHVRHPACANLLWVAECLGAPVVEADDERADNDLRALAILVALVLGCGLQIIGRIRDAHDASVRRAAPRIISSGRGLRIRIHLGDLEVEVRGDGHCRGVGERVDPAARRVRHGLAGAIARAVARAWLGLGLGLELGLRLGLGLGFRLGLGLGLGFRLGLGLGLSPPSSRMVRSTATSCCASPG